MSYEVWDDETWDAVSARQVEMVRDTGVLAPLADSGRHARRP
jgi:hypothetical protein